VCHHHSLLPIGEGNSSESGRCSYIFDSLSFPKGENIFIATSEQVQRPTMRHIEWVEDALAPGLNCLESEADFSSTTSSEVKNIRSCTSNTPYALIAWLRMKQRDSFTSISLVFIFC
jgi:hypothetical protein